MNGCSTPLLRALIQMHGPDRKLAKAQVEILEEQLQQKKLAAFLEDMKAKAKISITKLPGADKPAPTPPAAAK